MKIRRTKWPTPKPVEDELALLIRVTSPGMADLIMNDTPDDLTREQLYAARMVAVEAKLQLAHIVRRWREQCRVKA